MSYSLVKLKSEAVSKERNDWMFRHQAMKDELKSLKEECRKLNVAALSSHPPAEPHSRPDTTDRTTDVETSSGASLPFYTPSTYKEIEARPTSKYSDNLSCVHVQTPSLKYSSRHSHDGSHLETVIIPTSASSRHSKSTSNLAQDLYTIRYPETRLSDKAANKPLPHSSSTPRTKHNKERNASGVCHPSDDLIWTTLSHNEDASLLETSCSLKPQYIGYTKSGILGSNSQVAISPDQEYAAPQIGPQYQEHEVRVPSEDDVCSPYSLSSSASKTTVTCFTQKTELEHSRTKIHHLEKEVFLLEKQLAEKARSAKLHVEELTGIRAGLAQERSSVTILKKEIADNAAAKLKMVQDLHNIHCKELQDQLERLRADKINLEKELGNATLILRANQSNFSESLASLRTQLEQERESYCKSMQLLRSEIKRGCERMTYLEHSLEMCRREVEGHVSVVEESTQQHKLKVEHFQKQVQSLSLNLTQARDELRQKTDHATSIQREIVSSRREQVNVKQRLNETNVVCNSLLATVKNLRTSLETSRNEIVMLQEEKATLNTMSRNELVMLQEEKATLNTMLEEEQSFNAQLQTKVQQVMALLQKETQGRKDAESEAMRLGEELKLLEEQCAVCKEELKSVESRAAYQKKEVNAALTHMQEELTKRSQQVLEMDGLLRNHQADTAAHQLQLERNFAHKHAELRGRTQELEETVIKLEESRRKENDLKQIVESLKNSMAALKKEKDEDIKDEDIGLKVQRTMSSEKSEELQIKVTQLMQENERLKQRSSSEISTAQTHVRAYATD